jgi:hypothetical protein
MELFAGCRMAGRAGAGIIPLRPCWRWLRRRSVAGMKGYHAIAGWIADMRRRS